MPGVEESLLSLQEVFPRRQPVAATRAREQPTFFTDGSGLQKTVPPDSVLCLLSTPLFCCNGSASSSFPVHRWCAGAVQGAGGAGGACGQGADDNSPNSVYNSVFFVSGALLVCRCTAGVPLQGQYKALGEHVAKERTTQMKEQLEVFRKNLEEFASKHKVRHLPEGTVRIPHCTDDFATSMHRGQGWHTALASKHKVPHLPERFLCIPH